MTSPSPELPNTRLTRGWRKALYEEEIRRQQRRRRRRRTLRVAAVAGLLAATATVVAVLVVPGHGGGEKTTTRPAGPALPAFVTGAARRALAPTFEQAARESRVPTTLLMALTWRESEWENHLVSPAGAVGIGQLLPATSRFVARNLLHDPALNPHHAEDNIRLTARYLAELIGVFGGSQRLGVGAYLQGSTSVRTSGLSPQTIDYVDQINALRTQFEAAQQP